MPTPPSPVHFVQRLQKGQPITPVEEDNNWQLTDVYLNYLLSQFGVALNADGTLRDGSVGTDTIQSRAVTLDKLAFLSQFYADDTGTANAMIITFAHGIVPGLDTFKEGLVFFVKAAAGNTGSVTLKVDTTGPVAVRKFTAAGLVELVAGDIITNGVYAIVSDGTQYVLLNPTPLPPPETGLLHLLPPITVYTFVDPPPAGWQPPVNIAASVPAEAKSVLLAADLTMEGTSSSGPTWTVQVRSDITGSVQQLIYLVAGTDTGTGTYSQGEYLFSTTDLGGGNVRHFEYQILKTGSATSVSGKLYVVGYRT